MTSSVLLCDDDPGVCAEWVEAVRGVAPKEHYDVLDAPDNGKLRASIKELFRRQCAMLSDVRKRDDCLFDGVDILVLDYDLLHIDENNARHTGEALAWLARAFTTAEVVVVVNQFQEAHFDLSLLGHTYSQADLNLHADLLGSPGLWTDPPWNGFRAWHWQTLYRAVETQRERYRLVKDHFEEPIVEVLGMREEDLLRLSDTAVGFIAPDARDWGEVCKWTFKSFASNPANGRCASTLFEKDEEAAHRFAASRVGKWLERQVLGSQDVLVDLPHLIQFFPFLLGEDMHELEAWNAAVCDWESLKGRVPDGCWFELQGFLSRPAVWGQRFADDAGVRETRGTFDFSSTPPFVFLEDTSTFAPLQEAKQFRAGHHNASDWRFVKCVENVTYAPQRRLAYAE